jgi:catechol 2,3-dioxygenase-like lactoylglutathione lyase family enzyme
MSASAVAAPVTFHLSLNVADLKRSVAFYQILFDSEPAKFHDDYAKFEVMDPPVVMSLCPRSAGIGGSLSHVGLQVDNRAIIGQFIQRLAVAGIPVQTQNENKLWIKDPDGIYWEIYVNEGESPPIEISTKLETPAIEPAPGPLVWEHYLTAPFPERIPHSNDSLDEVRLTGTFNADLYEEQLRSHLQEAVRVLKPGGKVVAHGLMGDRPFPGAAPKLPGLAALVARIPIHTEAIDSFLAAGLVGIQAVKFTETPWFVHEGVEMREIKLIAWKPLANGVKGGHQVMYRGPFAQVVVDGGFLFRRGEPLCVPAKMWRELQVGGGAKQFIFYETTDDTCCAGS